MSVPRFLRSVAAGALATGIFAAAGLGLSAGTAQAKPRGPYQWCPGQHLPETDVVWDMNAATPGTGSTMDSRPTAATSFTRAIPRRRTWAAFPGCACPGCDDDRRKQS